MITKNLNGDLRDVHMIDNVLNSEAITTSNDRVIVNRHGSLSYEHMKEVQAFKEIVKTELSIVHDSLIEVSSNEFDVDGKEIHALDLTVTTKVIKNKFVKTYAGYSILGLTLERFDKILSPMGYELGHIDTGYYGHIKSNRFQMSYYKEII